MPLYDISSYGLNEQRLFLKELLNFFFLDLFLCRFIFFDNNAAIIPFLCVLFELPLLFLYGLVLMELRKNDPLLSDFLLFDNIFFLVHFHIIQNHFVPNINFGFETVDELDPISESIFSLSWTILRIYRKTCSTSHGLIFNMKRIVSLED